MPDIQNQINSSASILIVDDNMNNLQVLGSILHENGFNVIVAKDGESALKNAEKRTPDVILLDIMMPEMDGYEVCRRLRNKPETQHTPIIFLSAKQETDSVVKGFETGGNDYITKPFIKDELLARIRNQLFFSQANKNLKDMLNAKDRFFQIVAHDLKTPVNNQINFAELLHSNLEKFDTDKIKSFIGMIYETAVGQYKLLENLLEWTRLQTGILTTEPEHFEIEPLIEASIQLHQTAIQQKALTIEKSIPESISVNADKKMIDTVIRNIIANATKFTPENGSIQISATIKNENIELKIKDNGPGIDAEDLESLFILTPAKALERNGEEKGTGIGLMLSKEFIDLNNGDIAVNSTPGEGAEFIIHLPK